MDSTSPKPAARPRPDDSREERLKAALKANIARRKAQARVRVRQAAGDADETDNENT